MNDSTTPGQADGAERRTAPTFNRNYSPTDLISRRRALGITARDLAPLVGRDPGNYAKSEQGHRRVSDQLVERLREVEDWAARHYDDVLDSARAYIAAHPGEPALLRQHSAEEFGADPGARTRYAAFPVSLHETTVGRVASALEREGYDVTIQTAPATDRVPDGS